MIACCLFDLDGVIVDTARYHYLAWASLARELGFEFTPAAGEATKGVSRMASLDIVLREESLQLDDVVVIGYGTLDKRELTSSITSLKNSDLLAGNTASPLQAIAGKVPGLTIVSASVVVAFTSPLMGPSTMVAISARVSA